MNDLSTERPEFLKVTELLGGRQVLRRSLTHPLEVHEMLLQGLPTKALTYLVQNMVVLSWDAALEKAVGMSQRTYQRHASAARKSLNQEQTSRTWKLAEILSKATAILGSKETAEQWLEQPATGLNQQRPIDLLATPVGVDLVEEFLVRLEYGVYA